MPAKMNNITGQRFSRLIALCPTNLRSARSVIWECKCDCGNTLLVVITYLQFGRVRSCGCLCRETTAKLGRTGVKDITGRRFGRLVAIERTKEQQYRNYLWQCRCDCGSMVVVGGSNLRSGHTMSCGCLQDAIRFSRFTNINPTNVPFEITKTVKVRRELKKAIKQAS